MSAIFISHSSKNKDLAIELDRGLHEKGYQSVFLDVDREDGIIAGEKWEEVLYRELRTCQVLITLISEDWLASRWCFAELSHAREKGKSVIGLQLAPTVDQSVLSDTQIIAFTPAVRAEGYERLWEGLRNALDSRGFHRWTQKDKSGKPRSPYPGLSTFDESDAVVFFGRDEAVRDLKERLLAIRRDPSTNKRFLLVLGASGSGKSSLFRAGLVPLLKHDQYKEHWLVVAPFRPGTRPLNELAKAYAQAFKDHGNTRELAKVHKQVFKDHGDTDDWWGAIRELFQQALTSSSSEKVHDLGERMRLLAQRPQATLLIIIDQVEELLGQDEHQQIAQFFALLRMMMESHGYGILVLCTLRSDFLGEFQNHEHACQISYHPFHLESAELDFRDVIAGPAWVAGIELEDGLVEEMVKDTGTKDALPLLGFALRELWEDYGKDDKELTVDEYTKGLGRLEGAMDRKAEKVHKDHVASDEQEEKLRQAFQRMVRVDEDGRYLRQPVSRSKLAQQEVAILRPFVEARLLVSGGGKSDVVFEVAHEALFRGWKRMETWLKADSKFMLWHHQLRGDVKKWESKERDEGALLRGHLLADAEGWLAERSDDLEQAERDFITASANLRDRERTVREQIRKRITWGAIAVAVVLALTTLVAGFQWRDATRQQKLAEDGERRNRQYYYIGSMNLAQKYLSEESAPGSQILGYALLNTFLPVATAASKEDVRTFYWRYLWRLNHQELATLKGHVAGVSSVAFSPDGKTFVSGGWDGTVKVWDVQTRQAIATLKGHKKGVVSVAFAQNSETLATGSVDGTVKLWDVRTRDAIVTVAVGREGNHCWVAFAPDSKTLATGNVDGTVRLWDVLTHQAIATLADHEGNVNSVGFAPDGKTLATGYGDGTVRLWDVQTRQAIATLKGHEHKVRSVTFAPDGKTLATGGIGRTKEGEVKLWDVQTRQAIATLADHMGSLNSLAFSPNGKIVASGSGDGMVRLWDVQTRRAIATLKGHESNVNSVAFFPDGKTLATGSYDDTIKLWDVQARQAVVTLKGHEGNVNSVAFAPDGETLATGDGVGTVKLWDVQTRRQIVTLKRPYAEWINSVAFAPDGKTLVAVINGLGLELWDVQTRQPIVTLAGHGYLNSVAFAPNGKILATGYADGSVKLWDVQTRQPIATLAGHEAGINSVAFTPDGKTLVAVINGLGLELWDVQTRRQIVTMKGHEYQVVSVAFAPDGKILATGGSRRLSRGGEVKLWDAQTHQELVTLNDNEGMIQSVAFAPDGKTLASGSENGAVKLWDVATRQEVAMFKENADGVLSVAFSPDGKTLAAGSADKTVRLYVAATDEEVDRQRNK